jgi:succinyl-CoA synthetase alpha subunit
LWEAYEAGIQLAVCITEGIPAHDMLRVVATTPGMRIIGGNCPGLISPGKSLMGIMPAQVFMPGNVGMISRSGTLTYEIVDGLTRAGIGQSTCVGIGGDPIIGTTFVDCLRAFASDPETHAVVVSGEIGGSDEEDAAAFIHEHLPDKPVVAFIGGRSAPKGKRLGHAGAIISGTTGTPESKVRAFGEAGVPVADRPSDIPRLLAERLKPVTV